MATINNISDITEQDARKIYSTIRNQVNKFIIQVNDLLHEHGNFEDIYKKAMEEYDLLTSQQLSPVSSYATAPYDEPFYDASSELNIGGQKKNKTKKRAKRNKSTKRQRRNKRKSTKRT